MYVVKHGLVVYIASGHEFALGPTSGLYADPQSLPDVGEQDGVRHLALWPRSSPPDFIMAVKDTVVGVEMKRPGDMVSAWRTRRLARQIRSLMRECDRVVLLVRNYLPTLGDFDRVGRDYYGRFLRELMEFQVAGVLVVITSDESAAVIRSLGEVRAALAGVPPAALAGTDRGPQRRQTKKGWFLQNIKGVGPILAERLHQEYGSTGEALTRTEDWSRLKVSKSIVARAREALS